MSRHHNEDHSYQRKAQGDMPLGGNSLGARGACLSSDMKKERMCTHKYRKKTFEPGLVVQTVILDIWEAETEGRGGVTS